MGKRGYRDYEEEEEDDDEENSGDDEEMEEAEGGGSQNYSVELAKSGRSGCKGCGANIANRALRVGEEYQDEEYSGCRWYHPHCITIVPGTSTSKIKGFNSLSAGNKQIIRDLVDGGGISLPSPTTKKSLPVPNYGFGSSTPVKSVSPLATVGMGGFSAFNFTPPAYSLSSETEKKKKAGTALQRVVISVHNGQEDLKNIRSKVEKNSGSFSQAVDYSVTHVVSTREEVNKKFMMLPGVRAAIARRIPIVSESFVDEAIRQGRVPPVDGYLLWAGA